MTLPHFKSGITYSAKQRAGILLLFSIIILSQIVFYFFDFSPTDPGPPGKAAWISLQAKYDSVQRAGKIKAEKIYPFNPNFLTDYRGYKLGMSVVELDRLFAFRKTNRYVNSPEEFQQVTGVSDSLLSIIRPYFKFPDWVKNRKQNVYQNSYSKKERTTAKIVVTDINTATKEQLVAVYGIGDALSDRILKEREKFGGFVSMEQMHDVWGLSPELIEKLNLRFDVPVPPVLQKIPVNTATLKELMQFPYFRYKLAKEIITYRSMQGPIRNTEDLVKINGFPTQKAHIIALYLEF